MKKIKRNATVKMFKILTKAVEIIAFNNSNNLEGEPEVLSERKARTMVEDVELGHAHMYDLGDGQFKLYYMKDCWFEISMKH